MPSRFEPCGLNQMYSLRYGTVPLVHNVGGLADTVVDADAEAFDTEQTKTNANGFVFHEPSAAAFAKALARALLSYRERSEWRSLQMHGMSQDFSWHNSALAYQQLYEDARQTAAATTMTTASLVDAPASTVSTIPT
jgi:starch synthase